jgi:hypothetical protein
MGQRDTRRHSDCEKLRDSIIASQQNTNKKSIFARRKMTASKVEIFFSVSGELLDARHEKITLLKE